MLRLDRNAEGRPIAGGVLLDHQGDVQLVEPLGRHGNAHQPPPVPDHEVDDLGGDLLGGDRQVPLVLPVLVVHHDDQAAVAYVVQGLFDARHCRSGGKPILPSPAPGRPGDGQPASRPSPGDGQRGAPEGPLRDSQGRPPAGP